MGRRVVITGMGWVTPLGHDVASVWQRLLRGESGVGPITRFDATTYSTNFAAEVRDYRVEDFIQRPEAHRHAGLNSRFALGAAAQAWKQAGLDRFTGLNRRRMGIYLGAGEGQLDFDPFVATNLASWKADTRAINTVKWAEEAHRRLAGNREIEQEPNMALSHLAAQFGCRGPASNCLTACAASTQAIGEAFELIRHGDAEAMFAGGSHSMIHPLGITGFIRLTALSSRSDSCLTAARPFDQTRDGFVMGEGSGMLVLEALDHALARGGKPLAEIVGYGSSADAFRITDIQPEGKGAQASMTQALRQAGLDPRKTDAADRPLVHYISAHGTGTQENDKIETAAVRAVFGSLAPRIPVSSVKSMFGHLIAAAGAVELITCVQAILTGYLPPTMNLATPDPECDLDYVPNKARDERARGVDLCLSNSFGFGGQNDTLAVRRFTA
ncbi:MAG: beta-ketoacyl-[acyl-carrier-protein] synthase family protein [Phycisphaerae bacterium]|nr:beta-ketoacyl-[acyl-carrier-protein] synthase family protein [Phycisphaerae bacterium]